MDGGINDFQASTSLFNNTNNPNQKKRKSGYLVKGVM